MLSEKSNFKFAISFSEATLESPRVSNSSLLVEGFASFFDSATRLKRDLRRICAVYSRIHDTPKCRWFYLPKNLISNKFLVKQHSLNSRIIMRETYKFECWSSQPGKLFNQKSTKKRLRTSESELLSQTTLWAQYPLSLPKWSAECLEFALPRWAAHVHCITESVIESPASRHPRSMHLAANTETNNGPIWSARRSSAPTRRFEWFENNARSAQNGKGQCSSLRETFKFPAFFN